MSFLSFKTFANLVVRAQLLAALRKVSAAVKENEPACMMYEFFQPENEREIVLLEKSVFLISI
jgi:quinol monooxygenase YgiN